MECAKIYFEGKTDQELAEMLRTYLIGKNQISGDVIISICEVLAKREDPAADPSDIYRTHLAACFPEAVNANS